MLAKITYVCFKLFKGLLLILPRKVRYYLAQVIGLLFYYAIAKRRKIAIKNIRKRLGYSKSEAKFLAKEVFKDVAFKLTEIMTFSSWQAEDFDDRIKVEGLEYLKEVYNKDKPAIIFTGHFGNWELMGLYLARLGYPMNAVAKAQRNPYIYQEVQKTRQSYGGEVLDKDDARGIYKKLLADEFMVILGDQNKRSGVFIDFFGTEAATARGPAFLAKKTGAAIVPIYMLREDYNYRLIIKEPLYIAKDASQARELEILQNLHTDLEGMVKDYPKQWLWLHRRWKTRPDKDMMQ